MKDYTYEDMIKTTYQELYNLQSRTFVYFETLLGDQPEAMKHLLAYKPDKPKLIEFFEKYGDANLMVLARILDDLEDRMNKFWELNDEILDDYEFELPPEFE